MQEILRAAKTVGGMAGRAGKQIPHLQNERRQESRPGTSFSCARARVLRRFVVVSVRRTHSSRPHFQATLGITEQVSFPGACARERARGPVARDALLFPLSPSISPAPRPTDRPRPPHPHPRSFSNILFPLAVRFFRPFGYCLRKTTRLRSREGINHGLARRTTPLTPPHARARTCSCSPR